VSDGRVVRLDDGTLAGSAARMDELVRFMASLPDMAANRAVELATGVPARVLGEGRLGRIREGACSDLVVLDGDLRVKVTMVRGVVQFRRRS
jgi:N-acetylglucosamine-6-phosphate deacetylase